MNRRKKIKQILTKKDKQSNKKNIHKNKPKYIAKADREPAQLTEVNNELVSHSNDDV